VRAIHAETLPIGQLNVIAGCSTQVAGRDWLRALHAAGRGNSNASVAWMVVFDSTRFRGFVRRGQRGSFLCVSFRVSRGGAIFASQLEAKGIGIAAYLGLE
jgi:hypothetical protein